MNRRHVVQSDAPIDIVDAAVGAFKLLTGRSVWRLLAVIFAAGFPSAASAGSIPIPSTYVDTIDETKSTDQPIFDLVAEPGGNQDLVGVPSRLRFSGFAENLGPYDDGLVVIVLTQRYSFPNDRYDFFFHGTEWPDPYVVLPTSDELPIRVPIDVEVLLPFSSPEVTLRFGGITYSSEPGLHVAGTLVYEIGVPEPSSGTLLALACTALAIVRATHLRRASRPQLRVPLARLD